MLAHTHHRWAIMLAVWEKKTRDFFLHQEGFLIIPSYKLAELKSLLGHLCFFNYVINEKVNSQDTC